MPHRRCTRGRRRPERRMSDTSLFHESGVIVDHDGRAELFHDFLDTPTADSFLESLSVEVQWEQAELIVFGRKVVEPRMSVWYADNRMDYAYSGTSRAAHAFTPALDRLRREVQDRTGASFNSALVNLYRDGNDRLGWHADNEECNGPEPTIASLSFGAERHFDLRHRASGETRRVTLPHGSLLMMSGALQRHWVHQVPAMKKVGAPRINVTLRLVS